MEGVEGTGGSGSMGRTVALALGAVVVVAWLVRGDITPSSLPSEEMVEPTPDATAEPVPEESSDGEEHRDRWPSEPTGTMLALAWDGQLLLVDLDDRQIRTQVMPELTGGDPSHRLAARGEALVFWGGGDVHVLRPGHVGDLVAPPRLLATSTTFVPSAHPERVWVVQESGGGLRLLELDVDGDVAADVPAPHRQAPQLALSEHLVFADGRNQLWPLPGADTAIDLGGARVLAGQGSTLAWCAVAACDRLHLRDLDGGEDLWIEGEDWDRWTARFDPMGRNLALASPSEPAALHVLGSPPGSRIELPERQAVVGLTWSANGRILFAITQDGDLVVHRVPRGTTEVLDLGLPAVPDVVALSASGVGPQRAPRLLQALDADLQLWHAPGEVALYDPAARAYRWTVEIEVKETPNVAVVADGVLYLPASRGSEADTSPPRVRAIDLETGEVRWDAELLPGLDLQWAAPAVTAGLVLVVDTQSHPGSARTSYVHALDRATGEIVWWHDLEDAEQGFHSSPLLGDDHAGVVALASNSAVVGLDLATGQQRWRHEGRTLPQLVELADGILRIRHDGLSVRLRMTDGAVVEGEG